MVEQLSPESIRYAFSNAYIQKQPVVEQVICQEKPSKNVSKIMIFYSDNTFDTFVPEKNKKD